MKAVIIGATGATGQALLAQLLATVQVTQVTALVRRPVTLPDPKLQVELVDFERPEQWADLVRGDIAFSCMGTTLKAAGSKQAQYKVDYEYQYTFAKAAADNGIPCMVLVSAGMANPKSLVFYSRTKGRLEQAVTALAFKSLVIFRPGLLSRPGTDRAMEKWSESVLLFFNRLGIFKNMAPMPVNKLAALMGAYGLQAPPGIHLIGPARILKEVEAT